MGCGTIGVLSALAIIQCAAHSKAQVSCHGRAAGDRAAAREAFAVAEAKTAGVGQKMDLAFSLLRLDMAAGDWQVLRPSASRPVWPAPVHSTPVDLCCQPMCSNLSQVDPQAPRQKHPQAGPCVCCAACDVCNFVNRVRAPAPSLARFIIT